MKNLSPRLLILCTLVGVWLLLLVSINFQNTYASSETDSSSHIANVEINTRDREEIISLLNSAIEIWRSEPIRVEGVSTPILHEWFLFDVESTTDHFLEATDSKGFLFWKKSPQVQISLQVTATDELTSYLKENSFIDSEKTQKVILSAASSLKTEPIIPVLKDLSLFQNERISFETETISIPVSGLSLLTESINDSVVQSNEVFSFLDMMRSVNGVLNDEEIDFFASVLYSAVLQTNIEIVERHSQNMIPNYLQPGIEAKISIGEDKDLKFKNNNSFPVLIKSKIDGTNLLIEFYTEIASISATYSVTDRNEIEPRTIYRYSKDIALGKEQIVQEGSKGLRVSVYRLISEKNGPFEQESLISQDFYPPTNRIILKAPEIIETPIPSEDPDLTIDMNGDGLPDIENSSTSEVESSDDLTEDIEDKEKESSEDLTQENHNSDEEVLYDKGGNIIPSGGSS